MSKRLTDEDLRRCRTFITGAPGLVSSRAAIEWIEALLDEIDHGRNMCARPGGTCLPAVRS